MSQHPPVADRRIPDALKHYHARSGPRDGLDFLTFQDWFEAAEHKATDWITVAQMWDKGETNLYTFSALAALGRRNQNIDNILSTSDWDVRQRFGHPSFYRRGKGKRLWFDDGQRDVVRGVEFRPFVLVREFHGYIPARFELVQNFLLYHEAFFWEEEQAFQRIDDEGSVQTVARVSSDAENSQVQVDAFHLRDYLAAHKACLVRFHDHRRSSRANIDDVIPTGFRAEPIKDECLHFELWLRNDLRDSRHNSDSRLLGKDVVLPYDQPSAHHDWIPPQERQYVEFIIGRDARGELVRVTCNEAVLSNYYNDKGTPHGLTAVYFDRRVLAKYYDEPRRYSVGSSGISCLSLWSIPIDVNDEDLVQVWLLDLGRIPYAEQMHWQQYNVEPRGTITEHRYRRDFLAEFADPIDDPVVDFKRAYEALDKASRSRLGEPLLLRLNEADSHAYHSLRLPLTEEWKEFDELIQGLAKVTVDSLNVPLLQKLSARSIDGHTVRGSIDLLEGAFERQGCDQQDAAGALAAFRAIQSIRSTGAAHRKGAKFDEVISRLGLQGISRRRAFRTVLANVSAALTAMHGWCKAWSLEP